VLALYRDFIEHFDVWLEWEVELKDGTVRYVSCLGPLDKLDEVITGTPQGR
jgi:hypothetical protein